ncbi:MAG: NuoM family protein, partial [Planctomycetaceae bacterium]
MPTAIAEHLPLAAFLLPLSGAAIILLMSSAGLATVRCIALATVLGTLVTAILIIVEYDVAKAADATEPMPIQMVSSFRWLGSPGSIQQPSTAPLENEQTPTLDVIGPDIRFAVGVDGIAIWLVLLTAILAIPALMAATDVDRKSPSAFYAFLLLFLGAAIGLFTALDVILFVICLEVSTVAIYFLIGYWGGYDRRQIARKLIIYNLVGSALVLIGLTSLVIAHAWMTTTAAAPVPQLTFSIPRLIAEIPQAAVQDAGAEEYWRHVTPWIFTALLLGFAIKSPLIPFHTWMPEANYDAPAAVSLLLAGVALKFGFFGLIRFVVPLFPEMLSASEGLLLPLAVLGGIFAALITLGHDDMKRAVTYSCLVQLELCAAAVATMSVEGVFGAMLQLIAGGVAFGGLLFLIGELELRFQTRDIEAFSGLLQHFPRLSLCAAFFVFSLIATPGLAGFPGSWLSIIAMFQANIGALLGSEE